MNEVVDVTIDSGAGRNVWPKGQKVPGKLMPLKKKVKLVAANGSPIDVHGEKTIELQINGGRRCAMNFLVTGVKKLLASVGFIVDGGNRVIFDADGSFVESEATGERIPLKRKDWTFMMEMQVGPQDDEDDGDGAEPGFSPAGSVRHHSIGTGADCNRKTDDAVVLGPWSRTTRTWRLRWRPG